jgi:hypothetical protein
LARAITTTGYRIVNAVVAYANHVLITGDRIKPNEAIPWICIDIRGAARIVFTVILN